MFNKICNLYARLFSKKKLTRFNTFLYYLSLKGLGILNHQNHQISGENFLIQKITDYFGQTEPVIFDVGANVGDFSRLILANNPRARLFCFEPHPKNFAVLEKNLHGKADCHLFRIALSDKEEESVLFDYAENDGSEHACMHLDAFCNVHKHFSTEHSIKTKTVDQILEEEGIGIVDFLKIDVEGHELKVLRGADTALKSGRIRMIQFEFTQLNVFTRVFFKDFYDILNERFQIARLLPDGLMLIKDYNPALNEVFAYQNYLAINRNEMWNY